MQQSNVSRRQFALFAGTLAASPARAAAPTAWDLIKRIQENLGGDWPATGLDGIKAGNPETPVRGIATTAMATLAVLKQAAASGHNLILTHEPTFFGRADAPAPDDPVYTAKKDFIEKNNLILFRLNEHWQARKENDLITALAESLGWTHHRVSPDNSNNVFYDIPPATLEDTVAAIRKNLNLRGGLRAVGDRKARVHRVMLHPGLMSVNTMWQRFTDVDLLIAGEVREWECTHYAFDINNNGGKHALVTIGKVASEEPGMRACAAWVKTIIKEVPAQWIPVGDPYWRAV